MSDTNTNVDQLVAVYIKIRDARDEARRAADRVDSDFEEQLDTLNREILEICRATGANSIKTSHGTAIRTVKSRYWTNDWEKFYDFMFENNVPELLEKRIHQTNIKQFLEENPDLLPLGLNVDSEHSITVRRSK
jgi:predicted metal-dependent phosphotriesterase family hydrolase